MTPATACAYCGLPVRVRRREEAPVYCCYGCRFAAAVTGANQAEGANTWMLARLGVAIFLAMNVMVFTMALWTQDFYGPENGPLATPIFGLFRYLCMLFALPVLLLLGGPLLDQTVASLRRGELSTDCLLLAGVAASYVYSTISVYRDQGHVYFEVGCLVLVLVTLGRYLEARGKHQAMQALDGLRRLLPDMVRVCNADVEQTVNRTDLRPSDRVRVAAGERIPCDGVVLEKAVTIDEQILTGESRPRVKEPGDRVDGGTLNMECDLLLSAEPGAVVVERMAALLEKTRLQGGHYQRLAEGVSRVFLPAVMVLALGAAAYHGYSSGVEEGILAGLAVVVIACPCALGIATPLALWVALERAARRQVLVQSPEALERLAGVRAFAFDKTGTLTSGTSRVVEFVVADGEKRAEVLALAAAMAISSRHVHAEAIGRFATAQNSRCVSRVQTRTLPGRGLESLNGCETTLLGSPRLMQERGLTVPLGLRSRLDSCQPTVCLGSTGVVQGVFLLGEEWRPEVAKVFDDLAERGLVIEVLTGDSALVGLPSLPNVNGRARLLPEDKLTAIERLRHDSGPVAMVGDGINDVPSLAASDVGIAMGCGADIARSSAGICLSANDLTLIPWLHDLAKQTVRTIRGNLFWAFAYNTAGIGLACLGKLNPVLAAVAMVVSSALVVSNSLRLTRERTALATVPEEAPCLKDG